MFDLFQRVKDTRDSREHMEIKVDPKLKIGVTEDVYPKSCYDKSWDYVMSRRIEGMKLVHGHFIMFGKAWVDHAWVEIGNILFDGVYQRFYDKELYYKELGLVKDFEYTQVQVLEMSEKYGHKGAWESVLSKYIKEF